MCHVALRRDMTRCAKNSKAYRSAWLICMWHDPFICTTTHWYMTWRIRRRPALLIRDTLHLYATCFIHMRHASFICMTWRICNMPHSYATYIIHTWNAPPSYLTCLIHTWHASFICDMPHSYVTCLIHTWHASFICDMPHSYLTCLIHTWHASFIRDMPHSYVTCLIHTRNPPPSYLTCLIHMEHDFIHTWHVSFILNTRLIHIWHASFIFDIPHSHVTCLMHMWHTSFTYITTLSYAKYLSQRECSHARKKTKSLYITL